MAGYAALTTRPKQNINDFLSNILPELLKQKMQLDQVKKQAEIWLQNQLKEYEAYGEIQSKQGKESFKREALLKFLSPSFYEKRPMPEVDLAKTIRDFLPPEVSSELGVTIPPGAEQNLAASIAAMTDLGRSRQTLEQFPAEQIAPLVRVFGEKPLLDVLDQIRTEKQKAAELGVRGKELEEAVKSRGLRAEELGVRKAEADLEKKGQPKRTELQTDLERKEAERQRYIDVYWGTGKSIQERMSPKDVKERKVLTNRISDITDEIKGLKKKLGLIPDEKYSERVNKLKNLKPPVSPEDILANKDGIAETLVQNGFDIFKILEAWK